MSVSGINSLKAKLRTLKAVSNATSLAAYAGGLVVEGAAKVNIREEDLIDTGFMVNSVCTVSDKKGTYYKAKAAAEAKNPKESMLPAPNPKLGEAVVMVGAEYAGILHNNNTNPHPFLRKAVDENEKQVLEAVSNVIEKQVKAAVKGGVFRG